MTEIFRGVVLVILGTVFITSFLGMVFMSRDVEGAKVDAITFVGSGIGLAIVLS